MRALPPAPRTGALAVVAGADCEWHSFRGDLADVTAAVTSLADGFQLIRVDEDRWELRCSEPEIRGVLIVRTDSGESTRVGLQLAPIPAGSALAEAAEFMISAWPLWGILAIFGALSGLEPIAGVLGVALIALALVPIIALVIAALEASRVHQDRLWIADWRARFLPALTAHLTTRQPYR